MITAPKIDALQLTTFCTQCCDTGIGQAFTSTDIEASQFAGLLHYFHYTLIRDIQAALQSQVNQLDRLEQ